MSFDRIKSIFTDVQLGVYRVAIFSVALALRLSRSLLPPLDPTTTPLFSIALMVSGWYGGLLQTEQLSGLAINYLSIEPFSSLDIANFQTIAQLIIFLMAAIVIGLLDRSRRTAVKNAQASLQALQEARLQEQTAEAVNQAAESAAQEQLEKVLSSIRDGFCVFDRDWRFTYVNDRACEMVAMQREAMLGQKIWDLFADLIDSDVCVQLHQAMRERTSNSAEYFYPKWHRWYEYRVYPTSDGVAVWAADITDRKQAEAQLQRLSAEIEQQLRRFDAVASSVPDFIYTFDLSARFTYANQPLLDLWQKTLAESVGKNFWELDYPIELADRLQRQIQQVIAARQPLKDEALYTSASGTRAST